MRLNSDTYHWLKNHLTFPSGFADNRVSSIPNMPTVSIVYEDDGEKSGYKPRVIIDNPFLENTGGSEPVSVPVSVTFYYSIDQGLRYQKMELANLNISTPDVIP